MVFARLLAFRLVAVLLVPLLASYYLAEGFFPLEAEEQKAIVGFLAPLGVLAILLAGAAIYFLCGPVRRAFAKGAPQDEEVRRSAARAVLLLPSRLVKVLLAVCGLFVLAMALLSARVGLAQDLILAGVGVGVATSLLAVLLGYCAAALSAAPILVELGPVELTVKDTVATKLAFFGCALVLIPVLFLVSSGYARYRADADLQYVRDALEAQQRAAGLFEEAGATTLAQMGQAATGAPTAVLSADGTVLARSGMGLVAFAPSEPSSAARSEPFAGGWRIMSPVGKGTLVSLLPEAPLKERREAFFAHAGSAALTGIVAATLLILLVARSLALPVGLLARAVGRMASGDLTVRPPSTSTDEFGRLATDFRGMAKRLAALVVDVKAASEGVEAGTREMGEIGAQVKGGAKEEHERALAVRASVEAMQGSVAMVASGIDSLGDYVHSTSSAVSEMTAALQEVRRQAAELERRMDSAGDHVERLSETGKKVQARIADLDTLTLRARGTLEGVSASQSGLETSVVSGQLAAAQAAEMAERAGVVVQEALNGIEKVRAAVADAKKRVTALGRRSDDIDQILDFVGEVAGRTNLLSLNASIIATQAGEHGKAFAVVADQIRELAAQISSSTKSIGEIIRAVRDDVSGTARLIDRGDELAIDGVAHAQKSLDALQQIRSATAQGHETAAGILSAVQEHVHSTRDVSDVVTAVAENLHAFSEAVGLIGKSVSAVGGVSGGVGELADQVSRALEEQSGVGQRQLGSLERIDEMLNDVRRAVTNHDAATRRVKDALDHLNRTAERHEASVVELSGVAERLSGRSRALSDRVGRFKI